MMTPLPTPIQLQVAAMLMAGYTFSANLRLMQDLTRFALKAPFIPIRALQAGTAGAEKATAKTGKPAAKTLATTTPNGSKKSEVAAKPKATPQANLLVTAKAKDKANTAATAKAKIESETIATNQAKVDARTTAKPSSKKEAITPIKILVAPKPRDVEKTPASVKPDVLSKPDAGIAAKAKVETSPKKTLQVAMDSTPNLQAASQPKPAVSQITPNPVPKSGVSSAESADTTNPLKKARAPSSPPAMPSTPGKIKP